MKKLIFVLLSLTIGTASPGFGTPSTQIWNPSTDIQAKGAWHLGIDNYFSVADNNLTGKRYSAPTDVGLTYGLTRNIEVGFDYFGSQADPVTFNAKLGLPEKGNMPAVSVGGFGFGTWTPTSDPTRPATNQNIIYAVAAKTFKYAGRISLGTYSGNSKLMVDENGNSANNGFIVSWDKQLNAKFWASIDCATGTSWYGEVTPGFSYKFSSNTSIIFGYVIYNNRYVNPNNQLTTQLDIDF